jgi:hypothetical protein
MTAMMPMMASVQRLLGFASLPIITIAWTFVLLCGFEDQSGGRLVKTKQVAKTNPSKYLSFGQNTQHPT